MTLFLYARGLFRNRLHSLRNLDVFSCALVVNHVSASNRMKNRTSGVNISCGEVFVKQREIGI